MTDFRDDGHFRAYAPRKFNAARLEMLEAANLIISEYTARGMPMSLRQLYYQMVARGMLANDARNYGRLGDVINDGRLAGLVSWTAIEDRTRGLRGLTHYTTLKECAKQARESFRIDLWAGQPMRPEVWVEKDALVGVIEGICNKLRVDFFACRGYNSQSEQWRAGMRFANYVRKGQRPIVFHLGDHDPSGIDMTRDNQERLSMFAGTEIQVVRLALNMEQIERYNPPPNPAKLTDSRAEQYIIEYGDESWELDALPPEVIYELIESSVLRMRDEARWAASLAREEMMQDEFDNIIEEHFDV